MGNDLNAEAVNERLYRLETEVDSVKADLSDQKVAIARVTEQVTAHEKRGEERHTQLMSAITDMKTDYREVLKKQAEDSKMHLQAEHESARLRSEQQTKVLLAVIGLLSTIAGAIWGFSGQQSTQLAAPPAAQSAPSPAQPAPAAEPHSPP